jgi:E3 ubiquitin-protein ligase HECTD2
MSHPFPSLFTGKKKRNGEVGPIGGFESTDEDTISPIMVRNAGHNQVEKKKVPDKDLRTGKCMTCDSMVRWPKELKVFRCTVCLTINDLKPIALEARRGDGQRVPVTVKAGTYPGPSFPPRGAVEYLFQELRLLILVQLSLYLSRRPGKSLINAWPRTSWNG